MPKRQSPTNKTTGSILKYLNTAGHCAFRNNTTGMFDPSKGIYRRGPKSAIGTGDILCCLKGGQWLEIEVKTGRDTLSEAQIDRHDKIRDIGGIVLVVSSFDDFLAQFEAIKSPTAV